MQLVISDAHEGLKGAIAAVLDGASWQRCRTHAMRNLLTRVPKAAQPMVATLVRSVFEQPDAASVWDQHARVLTQLEERFPQAAAMLADAAPDLGSHTPLDRTWPDDHCLTELDRFRLSDLTPVGEPLHALRVRQLDAAGVPAHPVRAVL